MDIPFTIKELERASDISEFLNEYCEKLHKALKLPGYYEGWEFDDYYIRINYEVKYCGCCEGDHEYKLISFENLLDEAALMEQRIKEVAEAEEKERLRLIQVKRDREAQKEAAERREFERLQKKFNKEN